MDTLIPVDINPEEDPVVTLDPEYQKRLYLIEDALRLVGAKEKPSTGSPQYYDERLMELINAVPLN